jgi:phage FluMu gp28-like protein
MIRFDHPAMDLDAKYYSAIGEFIFRCAQLEYQIHEIIWMALGLGYKKGRILTIGMDAKALRGILNTITSTDNLIKNKKHIQEINSIALHSKEFSKLRNHLAHGSWQSPDATSRDAHLIYMKEKDERLLPKRSNVDHAEIHRQTNKLQGFNRRAQKLILELGGEPLPSRKK